LQLLLRIALVCVLALLASGCSGGQSALLPEPAATGLPPAETPAAHPGTNLQTGPLFLDVDRQDTAPNKPAVARSRLAKINQGLLLDEQGAARPMPPNAEITLNLFPDTTYTAVIEEVQQEGDSYTWVGHLQGVDMSSVIIVYTAGVFMANIASPAGIYEASSVGEDIYQIVQIDQQKLPGGEGDVTLLA
jgi:hypothetical protein